MNEQQIKELFSNEEFIDSLLALETPEEVQKALTDQGVDLSIQEILAIKDSIANSLDSEEELSEEQLETVTGGSFLVVAIISAVVTGLIKLGDAVDRWTNKRW